MEPRYLKVTLDTNVIISALVFGGNSKLIIEKIIRREFYVYTSPQLVSELIDKLVKKFGFSKKMILNLENQILLFFTIVYPKKSIKISRDADDNKVLETAVESDSSILITGDKDLLVLKKYNGIKIINAKDFVDRY